MVINYAHRGASEYFPENTLRSFYAGLEMCADGIETDIQRTKDGVLVLHHDDTLKRLVGIDARVCDFTYDELLGMDFGAFKGEKFAGEDCDVGRIPAALRREEPDPCIGDQAARRGGGCAGVH